MMKECESARDQLNRFLDGDLSATSATRVAAHLKSCIVCRREYDALRAIREGLRNARPFPPGQAQAAREALFNRLERDVTRGAKPNDNDRGGFFSPGWRELLRPVPFRWQSALATVGAVSVIALVMLAPSAPQNREPELTLPDATELGEMFRLHDVHGSDGGVTDPNLHRDDAADAHVSLSESGASMNP